mgnify:CR=1 FL=1
MEKTYDVDLTYNEIILLDGKVNDKAQKIINTAKMEKGFGFDNSSINCSTWYFFNVFPGWGLCNLIICLVSLLTKATREPEVQPRVSSE